MIHIDFPKNKFNVIVRSEKKGLRPMKNTIQYILEGRMVSLKTVSGDEENVKQLISSLKQISSGISCNTCVLRGDIPSLSLTVHIPCLSDSDKRTSVVRILTEFSSILDITTI